MLELGRRRFLISAASLIASPAIVRASSLMPFRQWDLDEIAIHGPDGRLWSLPEGLAIRTYPMGGFGVSVPPGRTPMFALHRPTGSTLLLRRGATDRVKSFGWVPAVDEAADFKALLPTWQRSSAYKK
jgi:hypothetical protein